MKMRFETSTSTIVERPAERLVLTGLRCWMAGYEHGDIHCWETAWRTFSSALGPAGARPVVSELHFWVRMLRQAAGRELSCFPYCCRYVCPDECMCLSLLAAHQHQDRPAARIAAGYLCGPHQGPSFDDLDEASSSFAAALADAGQVLLCPPGRMIDQILSEEAAAAAAATTKH